MKYINFPRMVDQHKNHQSLKNVKANVPNQCAKQNIKGIYSVLANWKKDFNYV